jgi:hypothetical protein
MVPEDKKTLNNTEVARQRVLKLEAIRNERGYKPGWLYFKCKEAGLLDALKQLEREGLVGSNTNASSQVPGESNKRLRLSCRGVAGALVSAQGKLSTAYHKFVPRKGEAWRGPPLQNHPTQPGANLR